MTGARAGCCAGRKRAFGVVVAALLAGSGSASADDAGADPGVTPYRPTVSNPADLPVPGWLEGEFGGQRVLADDRSREDSAPWLLKYAFDEDHGLLLGGNAFLRAVTPGQATRSSFGDVFLEWKQRFPLDEKTAFGIEAGMVAPTASRNLGIGKPEWLANGIFSTDLGAMHLDLNLGEVHGGEQPGGVSHWQTTWAAALSTSLTDRWGTAFELSGAHQRGMATQSQALVALSYGVSPRLVLDAGGAYGLTRAAHDRSFFAGATLLIGRLR
jgi:hypothetical protein